MATAVLEYKGADTTNGKQPPEPKYDVGVLAGLEWSPVKNAKLSDEEKNAVKALCQKAAKRDTPARLIEVIQAWEAALFYRGYQFLIPQRGGGWVIPGESTGYGPTMQMDLALLPTNIYSSRGQMIIAALTRSVPNVRFAPQSANSDAQITAAESADKFVKVIARNNDLIMVQTDAARYLWNDGRFIYWSRFVRDGQRFGWVEDDEPTDIVPENEGEAIQAEGQTDNVDAQVAATTATAENEGDSADSPQGEAGGEGGPAENTEEGEGAEADGSDEDEEEGEDEGEEVKRTPRGQEVRTAHGKLEFKLVPMMANDLDECDAVQFEMEVDISRAKGMCPWIAESITAGNQGASESDIARLARQNVKLGMQSTYVTSDSVAEDVTVQRTWFRPSALMSAPANVRESLIKKFPNGLYVMYMGDVFAFARNESMDDSLALGQAYSGDGQNRNAMGTSTMPIQKRLNNWLDLMNDFFVRAISKKWMDNKAFNVDALRGQTNVPGDIGAFKRQPGVPVNELIFVEPAVTPPQSLTDFIKEYSGPLAELLSGAYPALAGGDVGTADSGVAIATQRDSALGRLAPTWHSMKNAEAKSMKQLVTWGAKCRKKSINERIPGGEVITLEINDLKGNILCFAESDENFPETYTQRKNGVMTLFNDASKNPQLGEVFFNSANLEFMQSMWGLRDLYIPRVAARNKQLGEIEVMLKGAGPVPNPAVEQAREALDRVKAHLLVGGGDPMALQQAEQEIAAMPQEVSSIQVDPETEDVATEAETCWQYLNGDKGRADKKLNPNGYADVRLHYIASAQAAAQKSAAAQAPPQKPVSVSLNYKDAAAVDPGAGNQVLQKAGITPSPGAATPPGGPTAGGEPAKQAAPPIPQGTPAPTGAPVS